MSYSRADVALAQQLEQGLLENGISVWRDQEKIYGGQKWPKALGEAIDTNEFFLLAWSKNSAVSEYVELEWCTALALKKLILPCLLDGTPLPTSLKAIQAIDARDPASAISGIVKSLPKEAPAVDATHSAEVIKKLGEIPFREAKEVVQAAKALYEQHQWTVQGSVYQAAGDIHVTMVTHAAAKSDKALHEKWQTWVAVLVGLLTAITLAIDLPQKVIQMMRSTSDVESKQDGPVLAQPLSGSIRDQGGDPLPGVKVSLPEFDLTQSTDQFGHFRFQVNASKQKSVVLMAQKEGYQTHESYATLGNKSLSLTMRRKD